LDFISTLFSKEKEKNGRLAHHATKAIEEALSAMRKSIEEALYAMRQKHRESIAHHVAT
jgi:hypothetical protein